MKKRLTVILTAAVGLVVSVQAQVDAGFTLGEGYTNGVLVGQNGWSGNSNAVVDASNGIVMLSGYENINYLGESNDVSMVDTFETSMEFSFSEGYAVEGSNAVISVANKPLINLQVSGNYTGVTERIQAILYRNEAIGYRIVLGETAWNDPHFDGVNNQWPQDYVSSTVASNLVGISVGDEDYDSDHLKMTLTVVRGTNENLWAVDAKLFNLDTDPEMNNALINLSIDGMTHTNLFLASHLYAGFGGGQSDSNASFSNRKIARFTSEARLAPLPPTTLALWGKLGGAANDIIDGSDTNINLYPEITRWKLPLSGGSQFGTGNNTTYQPGDDVSPTNAVYYPNHTGFSPKFNLTSIARWMDNKVRDEGEWNTTDEFDFIEISLGNDQTNLEYMLTWEQLLEVPADLASFEAEVKADDYEGVLQSDVRFIFKNGDGNWYASEAQTAASGAWTYLTLDATAAQWFDFTPLNDGTAVIGAAATPTIEDPTVVGVWVKRATEAAKWGNEMHLRYFKATGAADIKVTLLEWGGASDIVDGSVSNDSPWKLAFNGLNSQTFVAGQDHSPTNSNYYPNRAGYSPSFNFTLNFSWADLFVRDRNEWNYQDNYDFIEINHGGNSASHATNLQYMLVWESFLSEPSGVKRFEAELRSDNYTDGVQISEMRFIFEDSTGNWYATESQSVPTRTGDDDWTEFVVDAEDVQWYAFTPMVNGEAVIGAEVDPDLSDITSAGLWYNRIVSPAQYGAGGSVRHFKLIGYSGVTSTPYGLWAYINEVTGDAGDDDDMDALSNYGEYIFGGLPLDPSDQGVQPTFDAASGHYIYSLVGDDALKAYVISCENLVYPVWVTNAVITVSETDGMLHAYTNDIGNAADQQFTKLLVE